MMQGQVTLITGAAKGIGRYVALSFVREGARVAVCDVDSLEDLSEEIRGMGGEVLAVNANVRDEDQVRGLMERVNAHFGRIDVLVNNAGIVTHFSWMPRWARIRDLEKSFWDRIIDTNLGGTFLCTKHVLPYMERQRSGHIVNTHGGRGPDRMGPGAGPYKISKEGIHVLTQYVAYEEREFNICVVSVSPSGAISTEETPEEIRQRMLGPESVGSLYTLAATVGTERSGELLQLTDGHLEATTPWGVR